METKKIEKTFDAVKMMREIRDKINKETQNMNFEQFKAYIKTKMTESNPKIVGHK